MAKLSDYKKSFDQRRARSFGEKFKKDIVKRIENNEYTVREVSKLYEVSTSSVYSWVYKHSILYQKGYRQVVEPMSSTKKVKELQTRIKELEQAVGQKQMKVDFLEKLIKITENDLGIDIKKKRVQNPALVLGAPQRDEYEPKPILYERRRNQAGPPRKVGPVDDEVWGVGPTRTWCSRG